MAGGKRDSPLKALVKSIKVSDRATTTPSLALMKIVDDYCRSGRFDDYLRDHAADMARYAERDTRPREGLFRASAAGKCQQQQVFKIVQARAIAAAKDAGVEPIALPEDRILRPARQYRALQNGTFGHIRWHMLFDALHEEKLVETLAAEQTRYNEKYLVSGTIDRLIRFLFNGKSITAIIDFKTINQRGYDKLIKPQDDHLKQQHVYDFFGWKADLWMMLYEAKDQNEIKIFEANYSDITRVRLQKMYIDMRKWIEAFYDEAARISLPLQTTYCKWCEFQSACLEENPNLPTIQEKGGDDDWSE
jgi:hypothetical protein